MGTWGRWGEGEMWRRETEGLREGETEGRGD